MLRVAIRRPDDWHLHLRDGAVLASVLPATAAVFGRAIVMPNLVPPVVTAAEAAAYRKRIRAQLPAGARFTPLMTAYLTEGTDPDDIAAGTRDGILTAVKLYPAGATTNSHAGVRSLPAVAGVLDRMQRIGLPLLVHGEVVDPEIDIFDREAVFLDRVLTPLRRDFPELRIVLEHVTTRDGVAWVRAQDDGRVGATITPHHLVLNRNDLLVGGIRPHLYCLPIVKREVHRLALRDAATSGDPRFFLGTDSAPHPVHAKEAACGCAGLFNAHAALPIYAQVFAEEGALDRLEAFASLNGAAFYGLPANADRIVLESAAPVLPARLTIAEGADIVVFDGNGPLQWRVAPA
jgi:dihydroorotase